MNKRNFDRGSFYYNMNKKQKRAKIKLYSTVMTQQPFAFKKKENKKNYKTKKKKLLK